MVSGQWDFSCVYTLQDLNYLFHWFFAFGYSPSSIILLVLHFLVCCSREIFGFSSFDGKGWTPSSSWDMEGMICSIFGKNYFIGWKINLDLCVDILLYGSLKSQLKFYFLKYVLYSLGELLSSVGFDSVGFWVSPSLVGSFFASLTIFIFIKVVFCTIKNLY